MSEKNRSVTNNWDEVPLVLTTRESANLLGVNLETMKKLLQKGKLNGTKIGNLWRINKSDLMKFMGL